MTDITCCECGSMTRDIEDLKEKGYRTVISYFMKLASDSCDNCGHDFCAKCIRTERGERTL